MKSYAEFTLIFCDFGIKIYFLNLQLQIRKKIVWSKIGVTPDKLFFTPEIILLFK